MNAAARLSVLFALAAIAGCGEAGIPPVVPVVPASITPGATPPATSVAGEVLPDSLVVVVRDAGGQAVSGISVHFVVLGGGGSVSPQTATTRSDGSARAAWTLGAAVGENTLEARVAGRSLTPATFAVGAIAGPAAKLTVVPDTPRINAIGRAVQLQAAATDRHGNPVEMPGPAQWTSLDGNLASASAEGEVVAHANGTARIQVSAAGIADTVSVVIRQVAASAGLHPAHASGRIGSHVKLGLSAVDSAGVAMPPALFDWSVTDTLVAAVQADTITFRGVGPVVVTATNGSVSAVATLHGTAEPWIAAGHGHTCVLTADGRVYCWGANDRGQLGDGTTVDRSQPRLVATDVRFTQLVAAGFTTCAIANGGRAYCWGDGFYGQLGHGSRGEGVMSTTPVAVVNGIAFQQLAASASHLCGLSQTGRAYCWGGNWRGELGRGNTQFASSPVAVEGNHTFQSLSVGASYGCGVTDHGVLCWGEVTGFAEDLWSYTPVATKLRHPFVQLSVGQLFGCGTTGSNQAYCWGWNAHWQLGDGTDTNSAVPVTVLGASQYASVHGGSLFACGRTPAGDAWCWGGNHQGAVGTGSFSTWVTTPTRVSGSHVFSQLTVGASHVCGITAGGGIYCWGANERGEVGDGTSTIARSPTRVLAAPVLTERRP